ncbi:lipopolysaccharide biosynthesis protein [Bacteroidia bacterium]|nr:lipopolysaccharide biosynthesis protein [Bacteroidia bacterium]
MPSLKNKTVSGVAWSSLERFSVQGIQFVMQIIMARILLPDDYGVIAMLAIFLAVSQTFIDSGFSSALVQKSDRSEVDYATVFYFNIVIGVFFFLGLFFSAPLIAQFYKLAALIPVTQVIALNLVISAFAVVPRAKLTILLDFKTQVKSSLSAVVLSGIIGIWMAYSGYGVWTLVIQSLLNNSLNTLLLWILSKWMPLWTFSIASFKRLFSYGSKMLFSALLDTIFVNIYTIVIGKKFAATELGYYSRADQFAQYPSGNISSVIGRVAFPAMCEIQNDDARLIEVYRKFLKISVFIIFPLMTGLAALSEPFIRYVLTEKWLPLVIYLQLLCASYMWYSVHGLNLTILQAKGRSDLFLRLEIIKKIIALITLIITVPMGITVMCIGSIVSGFICLYINVYYTKQLLNMGFLKQMKDILPTFLLAASMGVLVFMLTKIGLSDFLTLVIGTLSGILYFIGIAALFKMQEWRELYSIMIQYVKKINHLRDQGS